MADIRTRHRALVVEQMFGRMVPLNPIFPHELDEFVRRGKLSLRMTKDEIICRHTLLPYICTYLPQEQLQRAYKAVSNGPIDGATNSQASARGRLIPMFLRWCPQCVIDDRASYRETYWHRSHQLLGVPDCPKHHTTLIDSEVSTTLRDLGPTHTAEAIVPKDAHMYIGRERYRSERMKLLSKELVALLHHPRCSLWNASLDSTDVAVRAGYGTVRGLRAVELYADFKAYWGPILDHIQIRPLGREPNQHWLIRLLKSPFKVGSPIHCTMLRLFFEQSHGICLLSGEVTSASDCLPNGYFCPNPFAEHGVLQLADHTDVGRNTDAVRLDCSCGFSAVVPAESRGKPIPLSEIISVQSYGPSWDRKVLALSDSGETLTQISNRLAIPASSVGSIRRRALLTRGSIDQELGNCTSSSRGGRSRTVDWDTRDNDYAAKIDRAAACLERQSPLTWRSQAALLAEAEIQPEKMYASRPKLPKAFAALERHTESHESSVARKLRLSMSTLSSRSGSVTQRQLLAHAHVAPRRLTPHLKLLLSELLKEVQFRT